MLHGLFRSIPYVTPLIVIGEFLLYMQNKASLTGLLVTLFLAAFALSIYEKYIQG